MRPLVCDLGTAIGDFGRPRATGARPYRRVGRRRDGPVAPKRALFARPVQPAFAAQDLPGVTLGALDA